MTFITYLMTVPVLLLVSMLGSLRFGRWYGQRWRAASPGREVPSLGTVQGAIFGLLGLVVAFTFSGAAGRFDSRRQLVTEEANAIGTAYLRLDLLPAPDQPEIRDVFRRYVDARIAVYTSLPDLERAHAAQAESKGLQDQIWRLAQASCKTSPTASATMLLTPALNEMFDIATTRTSAAYLHPPLVVFGMLAGLSVLGAVLAGFELSSSERPPRLVSWAFALTMGFTFYVILDLEYPRLGFIRLDAIDRVMFEVRDSLR